MQVHDARVVPGIDVHVLGREQACESCSVV